MHIREVVKCAQKYINRHNRGMVVPLDDRTIDDPVPNVGGICQKACQAGSTRTVTFSIAAHIGVEHLETLGRMAGFGIGVVGTVRVDMAHGCTQVAGVREEEAEILTDYFGIRLKRHVVSPVRVGASIRQCLAHVNHEAGRHSTSGPATLHHQAMSCPMKPSAYDRIDVLCCHFRLKAKLPGVESPGKLVGKVVDHAGGEHKNPRLPARLNEDVDLNLGHVPEKPVLVLAGDSANLPLGDEVKKHTHSGALIDLG
ncbi:MAG: hypothetical protein M5R40_16905 [Anaerolineae bacterium]|nr:hypothetical protein [Anaerolineae bacterium]